MTIALKRDLWGLAIGPPEVDPEDLAEAVAAQARRPNPDFRTRLLIRDSIEALREYWGHSRLEEWLRSSSMKPIFDAICQEELGEPGFSSLRSRLMEKTDPEVVRAFFEELGEHVVKPVKLHIGGSIALILAGQLARSTEDIDVVNELPAEIRSQTKLLDQLKQRYGLLLTHFQSHYLPKGWDQRIHSLGSFGRMQVFLVDAYDIFLSKLYSARTKDRDDLRMLAPLMDKAVLIHRMLDTTADMRAAPGLLEKAEKNWKVLYGEPLPS